MSNTCKNCIFWESDNQYKGESWSKNVLGMADCKNEFLNTNEHPKVLSQDDAPDCGILTAPDFGCVFFKSK